jgi:hypothetical protein
LKGSSDRQKLIVSSAKVNEKVDAAAFAFPAVAAKSTGNGS